MGPEDTARDWGFDETDDCFDAVVGFTYAPASHEVFIA